MFKIPHNSAPNGGGITIKDSDFGSTRDAAALTVDGDSTGPGRLASLDSGGLPEVKVDVGGSGSLDTHKTVSYTAGGFSQASAPCVGGNGLAAASEGEADQPLHAPGYQGNVRPAQELVTGAGYCEQAAAAYSLASTDPPTLACTLEAIRDFRQGREDSLVQGETITAQHKQTQRDSKKARVATKQLQVAVSKVAKTCSEIGERITAIECRVDVLESDLGAVTIQAAMHVIQLSDIQWKVDNFENRQRRNNLRLIGIQEGPQSLIIKNEIIEKSLQKCIKVCPYALLRDARADIFTT
ncbi:hypothetical protein NDU88_000177 [Pleurodeles waltl]|uniref:Tektin n=1 Tax=Pleurodeles waltl TaxID=8319 RepID=A0AAV7SVQ5_PLEWA|nr:hypothetical protein NDU88_000177 [Pleurodeles waltl]